MFTRCIFGQIPSFTRKMRPGQSQIIGTRRFLRLLPGLGQGRQGAIGFFFVIFPVGRFCNISTFDQCDSKQSLVEILWEPYLVKAKAKAKDV